MIFLLRYCIKLISHLPQYNYAQASDVSHSSLIGHKVVAPQNLKNKFLGYVSYRILIIVRPSDSKTFCVAPWTQIATNSSGTYRVCCNATPGKNVLLDENDKLMRVHTHSAETAWNSPVLKKIRKQFLNSERPEMCQRCFSEEDSGVESARQRWNKDWSAPEPLSSEPEFHPQYIDLRLGNLCNLKCRMCNPYASSKWVDEWNDVSNHAELVPNNGLTPEEATRLKKMNWPDLDSTWNHLEPALKSLKEIYLTGGEPFLSLKQVDLLNKLVEQGFSKTVILRYNTNMTVLPKKLIGVWSHFKKVKLNISLDGFGSLNNYIRHPSDWEVIEDNLKALLKLKQEYGPRLLIGLHTTVQIYNIFKLGEILKYFKENFQLTPYLNILNHPHCLNIRTLSNNQKAEVRSKLNPFVDEFPMLKEVLAYMDEESWHPNYYQEFLRYTEKLDSLRGENFKDLQPEFFEHENI